MSETTEKPKKTRAAAKPRTAAGTAKKTAANTATAKTAAGKAAPQIPSHQEIARLAEQYWAERGHKDGHAEQDWLRAERELMKQAS
ncbi:MAG TPA: DUF2934 domain-containing protein [Acidobacteriaceae bacterium]|jgi:hypothetical protein|nr:DUF2934 domain-containing protein [Acidobacteriaceae bacterium]